MEAQARGAFMKVVKPKLEAVSYSGPHFFSFFFSSSIELIVLTFLLYCGILSSFLFWLDYQFPFAEILLFWLFEHELSYLKLKLYFVTFLK